MNDDAIEVKFRLDEALVHLFEAASIFRLLPCLVEAAPNSQLSALTPLPRLSARFITFASTSIAYSCELTCLIASQILQSQIDHR